MRKRFTSYKDYSTATMQDIFPNGELQQSKRLQVSETNSVCYLRTGNKFIKQLLPAEAQFSMITKIICDDFDHDGYKDLVLMGNHSDNRLKIGSIDANYGCLLKGDGRGGFSYLPQSVSGLNVAGDVKAAELMKIMGQSYLMIGAADHSLQVYKTRQDK
ncbi:MAG: hypothetical protein EOP49_15220 [Sphingobacteriales bacterium]|nr:MAG: hypothetical protein EOP49_15220 [Sphingobacteriales bacterium]